MQRTLLSFGHGYSARALARLLMQRGWRVVGTTRSPSRLESLGADCSEAVVWPGADMGPLLGEATHILISVAPDEQGDPVLSALHGELAVHAGHLDWVGYLSTTAVYGDHQGAWVDESTPVSPASRRGEWRVLAENQWRAFAEQHSLALAIFRLAGIYGPGRGPFAKLKAGTARRIVKPGQVFSRIHVEDIARVLAASIEKPRAGAIYNVCDDEPAPPEDVIGYAARLLGVPEPPAEDFATAEMTRMARSFYGENKRVRNDLIKRELGVKLQYPNYRAGLDALAGG